VTARNRLSGRGWWLAAYLAALMGIALAQAGSLAPWVRPAAYGVVLAGLLLRTAVVVAEEWRPWVRARAWGLLVGSAIAWVLSAAFTGGHVGMHPLWVEAVIFLPVLLWCLWEMASWGLDSGQAFFHPLFGRGAAAGSVVPRPWRGTLRWMGLFAAAMFVPVVIVGTVAWLVLRPR
jgi:hypothetical protein